MKGLRLSVYRSDRIGDCTNGGISAGADTVTVIGYRKGRSDEIQPLPRDCQVFEPDAEAPAVILVESALPGMYGPHLEPMDRDPGMVGPMSGGNYAGSSDSRWCKLGELFGDTRIDVVSIHDRFETPAQYAALSY